MLQAKSEPRRDDPLSSNDGAPSAYHASRQLSIGLSSRLMTGGQFASGESGTPSQTTFSMAEPTGMANHESAKTTKLYNRDDELRLTTTLSNKPY